MKRFLVVFLVCAAFAGMAAAEPSLPGAVCGLDADLLGLGEAVLGRRTQVSASIRLRLSEEFALRAVQTACSGFESWFLDSGLMLLYYPFQSGPFIGFSLIQFGFEAGNRVLDEKLVSLNEVCLGWTWDFKPPWFAEAALVVRDPSGAFEEKYDMVRGGFSGYGTFRLRISMGWNFIERGLK